MKTLTTKSLFYGKYPFKIVCRVTGAWRWRNEWTRKYWYSVNSNIDDEKNGVAFYKVAEKYLQDKSIKSRTEHTCVSFYISNESLVEKIKTELNSWVREIHQPASNLDQEFLLNNPKKVVCDQYPRKRFKYCVFLKTRIPAAKKESFYNFYKNNNHGKIYIPDSTVLFLKNIKHYGQFFIRVEDSATLLLVQLFLAEDTDKTVEYVLRDSINTQIGTE